MALSPIHADRIAELLGGNHEIQIGRFGERPEVSVARKKRNFAIDTSLGDQGIAQTRLASLRQDLRSQQSGAFPITGLNFDERDF